MSSCRRSTPSISEDEQARLSYKSTSLYAAAVRASGREPILLRQHFRSHPQIVEFANREVYGGQLVVRTPSERLLRGPPVVWVDVRGPWERGDANRSVRKPAEIDAVLDEVAVQWRELGAAGASIGAVSPFRAQVDRLRDLLADRLPDLVGKITIDTAYGFQGDERDVMLFSPAISSDLPAFTTRFAGNRNLVNVAVTRARSRLIVIGDHEASLGSGTLLGALAQYATDLGAVCA